MNQRQICVFLTGVKKNEVVDHLDINTTKYMDDIHFEKIS